MRTIPTGITETFDYSLTENGIGVTGIAMKIYIQRVSDSKWWDGNSWETTVTQLSMTEVDSTNLKGLYKYLSLPHGDMAAGDRYHVRYYNATSGYEVDVSEVVGVETPVAPANMALDSHLTSEIIRVVAVLDEMKNKAGTSGYDRTTDSLEALGDSAAGTVDANIVSIKGSAAETPAKLLSDLETIQNSIDDLMTGEIT